MDTKMEVCTQIDSKIQNSYFILLQLKMDLQRTETMNPMVKMKSRMGIASEKQMKRNRFLSWPKNLKLSKKKTTRLSV